ncbi:MAG: POTRA domain-containing protein, partial [Myxococcota bacterium]
CAQAAAGSPPRNCVTVARLPPGQSAAPGVVAAITVCGTCRVEPQAVAARLHTRVGQLLSSESVARDIRSVYELGPFDNVLARRQGVPNGGVLLEIEVRERPTLNHVRFTGNVRVKKDDLKEVITLQPHRAVQHHQLASSKEAIRKLYRDKGYFLADVSTRVTPKPQGGFAFSPESSSILSGGPPAATTSVAEASPRRGRTCPVEDITFHMQEGSPVRIEAVDFLGARRIHPDALRKVMRTKENHPLGLLAGWGKYVPEELAVDLQRVEFLYHSRGFIKVRVGRPRVSLAPDRGRLRIHIGLQEGEQHFLGTVTMDGDLLVSEKRQAERARSEGRVAFVRGDLLRLVSLGQGDVFNRPKFAQDVNRIVDRYRDEGYAYVNVDPRLAVDDETKHVDVALHVEAGPRVWFERIDIRGNGKTVEDVIRRELRVYEGELYSETLLRLSERRLRRLGFFKEVRFAKKPGSADEKMVLEIEVEEKSTVRAQVGGSWGTGGEGFVFQGQFGFDNLLGRGQTLSGQLQLSKFRQTFDGRFAEPYIGLLGQRPVSLSVAAHHHSSLMQSFERRSTGGSLTAGYPIGAGLAPVSQRWFKSALGTARDYIPDWENLQLLLRYRTERVKTEQPEVLTRLYDLHLGEPQHTTSLTPMLRLDQRNNRLDPTRGYLMQVHSEFAFGELGGLGWAALENAVAKPEDPDDVLVPARAVRFIGTGAAVRLYYDFDDWFIWKHWVLKLNLQLGWLHPLDGPLLSENYALGGPNTLRGYAFRSVSPVRLAVPLSPDEPLHDFRVGGTKRLLGNLELEFPIVAPIGLRSVVFFDFGNAYAPGENLFYAGQSSLSTYRNSAFDPARDLPLGLYASAGFGFRWMTPFGLLRFEFGFPLPARPAGTPGKREGDGPVQFTFSVGPSF